MYYIVATADCPPDDTPLISTRRELELDAQETESWRSKWSASFPGRASTLDEKLAWYESAGAYDEEQSWRSNKPDVGTVLPGILYEHCDDKVILQLVVPRPNVKKQLLNLSAKRAAVFMASKQRAAAPGSRTLKDKNSSSSSSLAGYSEWLSTSAPAAELRNGAKVVLSDIALMIRRMHEGALLDAEEDQAEVLVASMAVSKSDDVEERVIELRNLLGIEGVCECECVCAMSDGRYADEITLQDKIGELPFFVDASQTCCVAFELRLTNNEQEEAPAPPNEKRSVSVVLTELEEKHPASVCILVAPKNKKKQEEVGEIDVEDAHVLWLPAFHQEEYDRIRKHLEGEGETNHFIQRLQKNNTDSGNVTFAIVEAEWNWLAKRFRKDAQKQQKYFCTLLALTRAMVRKGYWMHDNESSEELASFVSKKLATKWRDLLKLDDASLGIGLPSSSGSSLFTTAASREALDALLAYFQEELLKYDLKFNLKGRKRKLPAAAAAGPT